jgi:hypothetical protein
MRQPASRRLGGCLTPRGESGTVLALAAVVVPVFLLLTALVVDAGDWFTHKRQLQNRADAGALAAGVDYSANWAACVQNDDPALKAATAAQIELEARTFAGDPTVTVAYNTEIADQRNVDVLLNSTSYGAGTDESDGGGPCVDHAGDEISPGGGQWMDVRAVERDLPSLFGSFGLPLSRNSARARIEIHPAVSDNGFIPLALPETEIAKAQVRYYNECTSPRALLGSTDLKPLAPVYQTVPGTVLWGPDTGGVTVDPSNIPLRLPPSADCAGEYIPIGVEVAVAGRSAIDLNQSCDVLAGLRFANCWSRLAEIRAWKDDPETTPWFKAVELTGASGTDGCRADPYFARNPTHCLYDVRVDVDWQDRDDGPLGVPANFSISVNGTPLTFVSESGDVETWVSQGSVDLTASGASSALLTWSWKDRDPTHSWGGVPCTAGDSTPCKGGAADIPVHRLFLATDANAGIVDVVRTSLALQPSGSQPGASLHSVFASGLQIMVSPTIGLRSALSAGQYRVLRAAGPQGNQSVDCDPTGGQGHDFQMFQNGCQPYYGFNHFGPPDDPVWWTANDDCPSKTTIFGLPNGPSAAEAWKCVPAAPGFSASVIADGIAARTGNCVRMQDNSCSSTRCNYPSRYPDTPDPNWAADPGDPRVVNLFVVPYGAFKGVQAQDGLPITKFPRFYVTGWGGNGSNDDPCLDDDPAEPGEIVGYFITFGEPGGPVDPMSSCIPGDLTPCRAVLVR